MNLLSLPVYWSNQAENLLFPFQYLFLKILRCILTVNRHVFLRQVATPGSSLGVAEIKIQIYGHLTTL